MKTKYKNDGSSGLRYVRALRQHEEEVELARIKREIVGENDDETAYLVMLGCTFDRFRE